MHQVVSWIPVHAAAASIIDLRNASALAVHLVHPRPVPWTDIAENISWLLSLPLIRYEAWVYKLQCAASSASEDEVRRNPALRLVEFYKASEAPSNHRSRLRNQEAMGLAMLETRNTELEAPSLAQERLPQLQKEDVANWISYWKKKKLLET